VQTSGYGPSAEARRIIVRMAERSLANLDELVDTFAEEVVKIPSYSADVVDLDEVRESARQSLSALLRKIAQRGEGHDAESVSTAIGRRRADQGMPLPDLMNAVRLDFRVIWASFIDQVHPEEMPAMLTGGMDVWNAVEAHAQHVLVSYQARTAESARALEDEQRRWVDLLLDSDGKRPDVISRVAQFVGIDAQRLFSVIVSPRELGVIDGIRDAAAARDMPHLVHDIGQIGVVVVQMPDGDAGVGELYRDAGCIVVDPVAGLRGVPHAVRLALACLDVTPTLATPRRAEEMWLTLAASSLGEFAHDLVDDVLGGLEDLSAEEQERLAETVETFLASGSVSTAAAALFCHRNTVFNRLARFRDVTGQDVTNVRDAARTTLALQARAARARD